MGIGLGMGVIGLWYWMSLGLLASASISRHWGLIDPESAG